MMASLTDSVPARGAAIETESPASGTAGRSSDSGWIAAWFAAATCAVILVAFQGDRMYADSLMDLYSGRFVWQHGLPTTDPFTIAGAGRPWIDGQWLSNLAFYGSWRIAGLAAVGWLSVVSLSGGFLLLSRSLRARGASFLTQALAPAGALLVALPALFPRAQNLVVPLFVALLSVVADAERRRGRADRRDAVSVAALAGLLVLWGNLHGSSLMAVALTAAYALYRFAGAIRSRRADRAQQGLPWLGLLAIAPLSLLATPYGFQIFEQYRAVLGHSDFHEYISEWAPIWQGQGVVQAAPAVLFALVVAGLAYRRRTRISIPIAACTAILVVATALESRYAVWLGIAAAAALAEVSASRPSAQQRPAARSSSLVPRALLGVALVWTCVLAWQLSVASDARALKLMPRSTVAVAYRAAVQHPGTALLGDLESAALMLWLHPDMRRRVEFDSRQEIFAPRDLARWYRYQRVQGPSWFSSTDGAGILLAAREWSGVLTQQLARPRPGWTIERTGDGIVLVRR